MSVVALAQRLRSLAEIHNIFVRSTRARDKWIVMGCVSLATPYAGAVPLFALGWFASSSRHSDMVDEGACPIGNAIVRHFYVTRPCIPHILERIEKLGSVELAEESLIDEMCNNPEHHHFFFPNNWYKSPIDTTTIVKEDM